MIAGGDFMMKWVFGILIAASVASGIALGRADKLTESVLTEGVNAVELGMYLMGGMCVWGGIMRVADRAGLTALLAKLFRLPARLIFRGLDLNGRAFGAICMNVTANLLGLGNAATPLGLTAMKALEEECGESEEPSPAMTVFAVLNTASITLIPTTAAMLRQKNGSTAPMEILPCVMITSAAALTASLTAALVLTGGKRRRSGGGD